MKKVIVIGGGAAGFFAAINVAAKFPRGAVMILEKTNKLLSKVKVSGGGRCNVTHAEFDPRELSHYYPRGKQELIGPFHYFSTGDTIAWFSERGIELKIEEDGRMFPITDSSQTIINCFLKEVEKYGIEIKSSTEVLSISKTDSFQLNCSNDTTYDTQNVIVAIGGNAKSKHYHFLESIGHTIKKPLPSLFTFNLPKHPSNQLMGLAFPVSVKLEGTNFEEDGPLLFTHWGMSGPAILKLSSKAAEYLYEKNYQFNFSVNWYPDAENFITHKRKNNSSNKIIKSKVVEMPQRLWDYLTSRANTPKEKNWGDLTKEQLDRLLSILTKDEYTANGKTTFKEEFVTCGGINLKEIDFKRMESKKIKGMYFCGEVMNVDALTGGFNFQAAWTSAYLVSQSIH